MSEISLEKEKTKLEKKLIKERGKKEAMEYVVKLEHSSREELDERLLELSKTAQGLINTKNADTTLKNLKDQVSERNRLHNDNIRRNKEHQRFVSLVISERFGDELMDVRKGSAQDEA